MIEREDVIADLRKALAVAPADPGGETVAPVIRTAGSYEPEVFAPLADESEEVL